MSTFLQELRCRIQAFSMEPPSLVGIYALPRGGSNFLSAWLHYHPEIFAVSERYMDWHSPLQRYWVRRSILRRHGVQDKQIRETRRTVFNKVQRSMGLWGPDVAYPDNTRMIFYLRNPVRIFLSRDAMGKVRSHESWWSASEENLERLLDEIATVITTYRRLSNRLPCLLMSHEYFCSHHLDVLPEIYRFLGVTDYVRPSPRKFLRHWESHGPTMPEECDERGVHWFVNPRTGERLSGYGGFNPLREIDLGDIRSGLWKETADIGRIMDAVRSRLGNSLADYYWKNDYGANLNLGE